MTLAAQRESRPVRMSKADHHHRWLRSRWSRCTLIGSAYWLDARRSRRSHIAKRPGATGADDDTPSRSTHDWAEETERRGARSQSASWSSGSSAHSRRAISARETAFAFLLPELIQLEPERVIAMSRARSRERLATAARRGARQWIRRICCRDRVDEVARRGRAAAPSLKPPWHIAPRDPAGAIEVADQFGMGRDDGSLEHLVQTLGDRGPGSRMRWIETQPNGPRTAPLARESS